MTVLACFTVLHPKSEEVLLGGIDGESNPGDGRVGESRGDQDGSVDGGHGAVESKIHQRSTPPAHTMSAIYTTILVASTLAYSAVAWIGLSIDTTEEQLC